MYGHFTHCLKCTDCKARISVPTDKKKLKGVCKKFAEESCVFKTFCIDLFAGHICKGPSQVYVTLTKVLAMRFLFTLSFSR